MDLKSNDISTIELDPDFILSYGLGNLTLESSIANDIFDFPEEVPKNEADSDSEKKVNESNGGPDKSASKLPPDDKSEIKIEAPSRIQKRKKDINGNDKPISDENLHCLLELDPAFLLSYELGNLTLESSIANDIFDFPEEVPKNEADSDSEKKVLLVQNEDLGPSDSDNETSEDSSLSKLKERGPIRSRRNANRSKDANNILSRNDSHDRSQFNNERLRHMSGSSHVQFNDTSVANQFTYNRDLTLNFNRNDSLTTLSCQDSLFEDFRASGVSSPESGYDSSIPGSPPKVTYSVSQNLDFIPETVDEQNILDFLVENTTDCALPDLNLASWNLESKDDKDKIKEIISYLKDTPVEKDELVGATSIASPPSECIHVPLVNNAPDLNTLPVPSSSVATKAGSKNIETPKKIIYKKLDDKAKNALKEFLSDDEYLAAQRRIYQRIQEDKDNKREIKVIYVADEADKASENRTNLHYAVLNSKIEDIFCLVEIQKQYNKPFTDINIRDKYGKTALDYAIGNEMALVVHYLIENTACQSVKI